MVVLLTPGAIGSRWIGWDVDYALGAKNCSKQLILVVVDDRGRVPTSGIPWIVRRMPWVEIQNGEVGLAQVKPIADAIRSHA